jgi:hypothetical protein
MGSPMSDNKNQFKERVKNELKVALAYFIERQKLVAQAITEMGSDLGEVAEYGALAWASGSNSENRETQSTTDHYENDVKSDNEEIREIFQYMAKRASERNLPQEGIWYDNEQNEWIYFLHGNGCRLTNKKTGEPIDWDCPDVNSYDPYKFLFHLIWQLSSIERSGMLISTHIWASNSLEPLLDKIKTEDPKQ